MRRYLGIIALCLLAAGCAEKPAQYTTCTLTSPAKRQFVLNVEVRDDDAGRAEGLMYRKSLADDEGMLFIWPDTKQRHMWMKNTLVSLDMLFLQDNRVVGKIENTEPLSQTILTIPEPANRILEVKAGRLIRWGVNNQWLLDCNLPQ